MQVLLMQGTKQSFLNDFLKQKSICAHRFPIKDFRNDGYFSYYLLGLLTSLDKILLTLCLGVLVNF